MRKTTRFTAAAVALPMILAASGCSLVAAGEKTNAEQLVYMNSGGVLLEAETAAFLEEFTKSTGIEVVTVSPVDMAKVKTQVAAGRVDVDVVQWNSEDAKTLCDDVLDPIGKDLDLSQINSDYIVSECGVPAATFVHTYFYDADVYGDNPPQTWADFFDSTAFPGTRAVWNSGVGTNFEQGLLGAGVGAEDLYPMDLDRSLSSWDRIADDLSFWSTPAELVQLLQNSSAPLISAWGPAATQAVRAGASNYVPVMSAPIYLFNQYVVPKGAPHRETALKFIEFVTSKQSQTALVSSYPEGPTNTTVDVTQFADATLEKYSPGNFVNDAVNIDAGWRAAHLSEMAEAWNAWATQ